MKEKIIAVITSIVIICWLAIPRHHTNQFYVESIIDYEKGINVHYPLTGNEKLDKDIYSFISSTIRIHEENIKDSLLNISFECYSSIFTVIRFKITTEKESSIRSSHLIKTEYKNFYTFKRGSNIAVSTSFDLTSADALPNDTDDPLINSPLENKKLVALTFDDGPSEHTMEIINILDSYGVKATFCLLGTKISTYRQTVEIMYSGGHEIANHTYNHQKLTSLEDEDMQAEVQRTQDAIYEITGQYPSFLRPTYGAINSRVRSQIKMPILMWSKDTLDWQSRNADYIFSKAVEGLKDGDIILFHDLYPSTVEAIKKLIPYLLKNGYYPVTASKLLTLRGIKAVDGKAYFSSSSST